MPGPIAHILLALSILPKDLTNANVREFVLGTSFPDIRYIAKNIKKEDTHFKNITLDMVKKEIQDKKFWQAGLHFHSLVDVLSDKYKHQKNIYKIMPRSENAIRAIKYLEDKILYSQIQDKKKIMKYFDVILDQELLFGASKRNVRNWHTFMQTYCEKQMDPEHFLVCYLILKYPWIPKFIIKIIAYLAFWLKILPSNFLKIIEVIQECEKNEKLVKRINNFYDNFEDICQNYHDQQFLSLQSTNT